MTRGIVSAGDAQTAAAGAAILQAGGNAIDAVVAAAVASWVVEPPLGGPAGAGLMLHCDQGEVQLLDFFTRVPGLGLPPVDPASLDFHPVEIDFGPTTQSFHVGRGSVALPTAVWGLVDTHAAHGSLPLAEVIEPARRLAAEGWILSHHLQLVLGFLEPILTLTPSVRELHCIDGGIPEAGTRMFNPGLAKLFEGIAAEGRAFLDGPYRQALLDQFGTAAGGRLTKLDLDSIQLERRRPLRARFCDHTVICPSPPASGGALAILSLKLAEAVHLPSETWMSPAWTQKVVRVLRAVSNARGAGFDEDVFRPGSAERLLNTDSQHDWLSIATAEEKNRGETTHISVLDGRGGAASFTQSNGEGCGSALAGYGVHLNNFLGEADINPGGFHARPAGSVMTTMMTPTLVLDDQQQPVFVVGSAGANRIRSAVFLAVLARIGHGCSIERASNAPRIHVEGERVWWEDVDELRASREVLKQALEQPIPFEHRSMFFGGVNAVGIQDGQAAGAGDGRRGGACVVT